MRTSAFSGTVGGKRGSGSFGDPALPTSEIKTPDMVSMA